MFLFTVWLKTTPTTKYLQTNPGDPWRQIALQLPLVQRYLSAKCGPLRIWRCAGDWGAMGEKKVWLKHIETTYYFIKYDFKITLPPIMFFVDYVVVSPHNPLLLSGCSHLRMVAKTSFRSVLWPCLKAILKAKVLRCTNSCNIKVVGASWDGMLPPVFETNW